MPRSPESFAGRAGGSRRALGRYGERLAERQLRREGFRILARNLNLRYAELDLVALEGDTLCFVEVRLRSSAAFGSPEESVGRTKRRRLAWAARQALVRFDWPPHRAVRFDVVAVDARAHPPRVRLIREAFYPESR